MTQVCFLYCCAHGWTIGHVFWLITLKLGMPGKLNGCLRRVVKYGGGMGGTLHHPGVVPPDQSHRFSGHSLSWAGCWMAWGLCAAHWLSGCTSDHAASDTGSSRCGLRTTSGTLAACAGLFPSGSGMDANNCANFLSSFSLFHSYLDNINVLESLHRILTKKVFDINNIFML